MMARLHLLSTVKGIKALSLSIYHAIDVYHVLQLYFENKAWLFLNLWQLAQQSRVFFGR